MGKQRILIVEDETLTAINLERILRSFGYEIFGNVISGEEAVDLVKSDYPDLILMDIQLAGDLDGIETAGIIASKRNVPVIFTTAHSDEATLARAKSTAPYGYLIKPVNRAEIKSVIELALYRFAMELKLLRSEEKYRELVDNINDTLYSIDETGTVTFISDRALEAAGFNVHDIVGKPFTSFVHEEDARAIKELFIKNSRGHMEKIDFRVYNKSGELIWLKANSRPMIVDGRFRGVKGVMTNITAAKNAELELEKKSREAEAAKTALEHEKNLLALIMEMTPAAIVMLNSRGVIKYCNLRAEKILGYPRNELIGEYYNPGRWAFLDPEGNDNPRERNPFLIALREGRPSEDIEVLLVRPDQKSINLVITASPLFAATGGVESVVLSFIDITASKEAEEEIKASLKEKEMLLREINHRVKNNFQIVTSLISLQAQKFHDERDIDLIGQTVQRIRSMTMIYEKLNSSDSFSTIDLGEYIGGLADEIIGSLNTDETIKIRKKLESIIVPVRTAVFCGIIINELLTNVVKHAFPGGRQGHVTVECSLSGDEVVLEVSDDGVGAPPGFNSADSSSIGIQLIYALVSQMEASLDFSSEGGTRCRLSFLLPEAQVSE